MGTAPLDMPPPLPPTIGQQQPSPPQPQDGGQQASGTAASTVMQHMMTAEKELQAAATVMPQLGPIMDSVIQNLRAGAGKIIMAQAQPQQGMQGGLGIGPMPPQQ